MTGHTEAVRLGPRPIRIYHGAARRVRYLWQAAALSSDIATFRALTRYVLREQRRPGTVTVRLRPLGSAPLVLRTDASDPNVVWTTFVGRFHRPTPALADGPALILDLGANIGATAADLACLYPAARIVAVELDARNAELCRLNTRPWSDRIEVVEAAVWHERGVVRYRIDPGSEWSAAVEPAASETARAVTVPDLLDGWSGPVAFVKMDIEGAEREVLARSDSWAGRVTAMNVELHKGYTADDCAGDLGRSGFSVREDATHHAAVVATRPLG